MQINLPKCDWCQRPKMESYKCRSCGKQSCNDCHLGYNESDRCNHMKYEPFSSDNWQLSNV